MPDFHRLPPEITAHLAGETPLFAVRAKSDTRWINLVGLAALIAIWDTITGVIFSVTFWPMIQSDDSIFDTDDYIELIFDDLLLLFVVGLFMFIGVLLTLSLVYGIFRKIFLPGPWFIGTEKGLLQSKEGSEHELHHWWSFEIPDALQIAQYIRERIQV
jgi:hypothetical protein